MVNLPFNFVLPTYFPSLPSDNTYIEVLDSTRVHPETYEWARKMAVDALEYDEVRNHLRLPGDTWVDLVMCFCPIPDWG